MTAQDIFLHGVRGPDGRTYYDRELLASAHRKHATRLLAESGAGTGDDADFPGAGYDEDKDLLQVLSQWVAADKLDAAVKQVKGWATRSRLGPAAGVPGQMTVKAEVQPAQRTANPAVAAEEQMARAYEAGVIQEIGRSPDGRYVFMSDGSHVDTLTDDIAQVGGLFDERSEGVMPVIDPGPRVRLPDPGPARAEALRKHNQREDLISQFANQPRARKQLSAAEIVVLERLGISREQVAKPEVFDQLQAGDIGEL